MSLWQSNVRVKNMKTLVTSLFLLFYTGAYAQEPTKFFLTRHPCGPWKDAANQLSKYNEHILFTGTAIQFDEKNVSYISKVLFQVNQETGSWSLVSIYGDGNACIVASGQEFSPYAGN